MTIEFKKPKSVGGEIKIVLHRHGKPPKVESTTPFFARHDLTHYAVETILRLERAFWGLLSEGWDVNSFEERQPGSRKSVELPPEALLAERCVSLFDLESAGCPEFNAESASAHFENSGWDRLEVTNEELNAIREMRAQLFAQWDSTPLNGSLRLEFPKS